MGINQKLLEEVSYELNRKAATTLPDDFVDAFKASTEKSNSPIEQSVLDSMIENMDISEKEQRPVCADVGCPRFYVKLGNEAAIDGGLFSLESSIRRATERITLDLPLRSNRCHPLTRENKGNNVGILAPNIDYSVEPDADWIDLTAVHKGGGFHTDFRNLFSGEGIDGIKRFFVEVAGQFGPRGLACQPLIGGVGIGGTKDMALAMAKMASCLRVVGDRHPDPVVAKLEDELLELANSTGIGVMGFPGSLFAVDVHVEISYVHSAFLTTGISHFCQAARRATGRIHADGTVEYRTDPKWFTPYYRRDTVEWEGGSNG